MIDSVGVEIPVSVEAAQKVAAKLGYRRVTERVEDGELRPVWERQDVEFWPSSERKIVGHVKLNGSHHLDFPALVIFPSFSVPKLVYGHNVAMLYDLHKGLECFRGLMMREFGLTASNVAPVKSWGLSRLDLCYAFRIGERNVALMLAYLKRVEQSRKEALVYPNTVLWKGREVSAKFYGKGEEFQKHDGQELVNGGRLELAREWYGPAKETLRFEVTLRRPSLQRALDRHVPLVGLVDRDFVESRLRYYLRKVTMDFRNEVWDFNDCLERIESACVGTRGKAARLMGFYAMYYTVGATKCREVVGRSQFFANRRELRDLGIKLVDVEEELPEDLAGLWLDIPSPYAVNDEDLPFIYEDEEWQQENDGQEALF